MPEATINTRHGELPGYFANPAGDGPWPGVVVVHDAAGVIRDARRLAGWLAGVGCLAAAPDPFSRGWPLRSLIAVSRQSTRGAGPVSGEPAPDPVHLIAAGESPGRGLSCELIFSGRLHLPAMPGPRRRR